ncbi:MAG TPA: fused MFS/spermidine synthase [Turneriella sp.]|nr:fused MFS/spermidine synthase [Turneriella sp.]
MEKGTTKILDWRTVSVEKIFIVMQKYTYFFLLFFIVCTGKNTVVGAGKKKLEIEKSPFGVVSVYDLDGKRYISIGEQEQSAVNLTNKREWVYSYMYLLSLGVLAHERLDGQVPQQVLLIGLGGGSFADFLAEVFPLWQITVVELNPAVIRLAKKYFPLSEKIRIVEGDGRVYLKNTHSQYDVIVMDAFGEHFIPPELYTVEYFRLLKSRVLPQGLVLVNTWEGTPFEMAEVQTLRSVFRTGYYIHHIDETPSNRIYVLGDALPRRKNLQEKIKREFYERHFTGGNPTRFLQSMVDLSTVRTNARVITDRSVRTLFIKRQAVD